MEQVNLKVDSTQSIGFFSRLQQASTNIIPENEINKQESPVPITSNEPPKPVPITTNEPPKPVPITTKGPPKPIPITSREPPKPVDQNEKSIEIEQQPQQPQQQPEQPQQPQQQPEQPQQQPEQPQQQPEQPQQQLGDDRLQFINKLNSEPRSIGHNKFQGRISELETIVEEYKRKEQESDMKINLFKKSITTLQTQLQEKSAHISRLETKHIDPQYEKQITDLNQALSDKQSTIDLLKADILTGQREVDFLNLKCDDLLTQKDLAVQQMNDIKQRYLSLENNHQRQAIQLQMNTETISKLENRLGLEENLRINLENELESMKSELVVYRTDIKNLTIEKDNEIQRLRDQLENCNFTEEKQIDKDQKLEPIMVTRSVANIRKKLSRNISGFRN